MAKQFLIHYDNPLYSDYHEEVSKIECYTKCVDLDLAVTEVIELGILYLYKRDNATAQKLLYILNDWVGANSPLVSTWYLMQGACVALQNLLVDPSNQEELEVFTINFIDMLSYMCDGIILIPECSAIEAGGYIVLNIPTATIKYLQEEQ